MNSMILGLLAETSIHPGAGQSAGFVDLPVAREAATDYPVIVGSSMKGALLDMAFHAAKSAAIAEGQSEEDAKKTARKKVEPTFGTQEKAGELLVSDARLILLPIRSLKTQYKWVTCPHLIERLLRDRSRECGSVDSLAIPSFGDQQYLGASDGDGNLFLEERQFSQSSELPPGLTDLIRPLIASDLAAKRLESQLVVISDKDFVWFARYGLAVNARNVLNETKKTSENLWYEETIPPDALFYCLLAERNSGAINAAKQLFSNRPYLQVGGNETVGQGWFAVALQNGASTNRGAA